MNGALLILSCLRRPRAHLYSLDLEGNTTQGTMAECGEIQELSPITDGRGNLLFLEEERHVPFEIKRTYYLYDVPASVERGKHAHFELEQMMFVVGGSIEVELFDGTNRSTYLLDSPKKALLIPKMTWRVMRNFTKGAVCVVLASMPYQEEDYIREYDDFLRIIQE
jgi:dTDP-4-dehydrorhamnose 3,5-epimerase-like enzyme